MDSFPTPLLWNFVPSVSPLYRYATQGRSAQCYPYTETEMPLSILSLCRAPQHYGVFCIAKYRGGVRRTEGLKTAYRERLLFNPLPLCGEAI